MNWGGIITVFFAASIKFLFAPSIGLHGFEFPLWETILICSAGGVTGVTVFYLFADFLMDRSRKKKQEQEKRMKEAGTFVPAKFHSARKRRIIRIKQRFGLFGIAAVTPCIISIPIGSVIAARFYKNKQKTLTALYLSVFVWAVLLTLLNEQVERLIHFLFP
ncbi:MAG: hypothetical protein ACOZCO_00125 [Bacteroidota bacterium]